MTDSQFRNHVTLAQLCLCVIIAAAMSALTFNGVSVSGAEGGPTITNNSTKPLMGCILQRLDTNGVNPVFHDVDYDALAHGTPIQPGQSVTHMMMGTFTYATKRVVDGKVTTVKEGGTVGYKILAVLFADGTYYGPADQATSDALYQRLSSDISTVRSMARDTQYLGLQERNKALRQHMFPTLTRNASTDITGRAHRRSMAAVFLRIRDNEGDDKATEAIGRVAALPDVVRGE